ncbi:MAG: sulfatase-like hydrolase/transferase [Rhizobiaceae bacterium]
MTGKKVLCVVIDQFRADCLQGALESELALPNLRALAQDSVSFNQHYTVVTPCGPSRASLLTGLYAMNHRSVRNGTPLQSHYATLGSELRKCGYEPLLFGYTDASADPFGKHPNDPDLKTYEGVAPGFSEIVQMRLETSSSWVGYLKGKGYDLPDNYWNLYAAIGEDGTRESAQICDPVLYAAEDSDTAFLTNRTIEELSARENQDWFALVTYIRPHPPLAAPHPYNKMYDPKGLSLPVRQNHLNDHMDCHPYFAANYAEPGNFHLYVGFDGNQKAICDEDVAALRAVYFGLATEVDHHIGRLIDYLHKSGQFDDTMIIVTADHGEHLGDHYMWGKHGPFDSALHIPLIIRDPRGRSHAAKSIDHFTESIDVAPTVLDWLGGEAPLAFNGRSLLPFVSAEPPANWRNHIFAEVDFSDPIHPSAAQKFLQLDQFQANYAVLRDERFKYVHFNGGLPPLLYDIKNDPQELNNLAGLDEYAADVSRLSRLMLDHRMTHADHATSRMKLMSTGVQST